MKYLCLLLVSAFFLSCDNNKTVSGSQIPGIIPRPVEIVTMPGFFEMNNRTFINIQNNDIQSLRLVKFLNDLAVNYIGARLEVSAKNLKNNFICLRINQDLNLGQEGYHMLIDHDKILIEGSAPHGIFYGIQTLRQILPPVKSQPSVRLPSIEITDQPRFSWRGLHLDVSRHFMPVDFVRKYIDYMAMHKLNTFHWHLTDDQGWRIEIKKYPKLTEIGAWRDSTIIGKNRDEPRKYDRIRHGGYYSEEEIRSVVEYAKERFITIVPEIEMPGHAQAAIAAYPELGVTGEKVGVRPLWGISPYIYNVDESTFVFLKNVLTEVMDLFPGKFIHVGGDEAIKDQWKASGKVQNKIKQLGLTNEDELQSWFISRIDSFLVQHDRRLIGWDEILQGGLAPNAAVMSWRGEEGGIKAAKMGHDVVMSPTDYCYFDYYQADRKIEPIAIGGYLPVKKVYSYDPVPSSLADDEKEHILGVQANVWTEYMPGPDKVEYMVFPRIAALSEVAWTEPSAKNWGDFRKRLTHLVRFYDMMNINYSKNALKE